MATPQSVLLAWGCPAINGEGDLLALQPPTQLTLRLQRRLLHTLCTAKPELLFPLAHRPLLQNISAQDLWRGLRMTLACDEQWGKQGNE